MMVVAMSEVIVVGAIMVVSLVIAWILSIRYHSQSRTLESAVRIPLNLTWMLAAAFTIIGGYYKTGAALMIVGAYFFFSNAHRVRNGDISASPSSWRQRVANWNPVDHSR